MTSDGFFDDYREKRTKFPNDLWNDVCNGKFMMDLNKVTNIDEFEKLCHYIYYEHPCIAQKIPYSFTMFAACCLFEKLHFEDENYDRDLLREMNHRAIERMNEDIAEYSRNQFQKEFEKANGKSWYQFW